MRAIVLCAGRGQRLRPWTDDRPKCLLEIGGRTILERCLASLRGAGIEDILLVTGYRSGMIEAEARRIGAAGLRFVSNPDFEATNTAVSLRIALAASPGLDCLQLNGDVVFDGTLLDDLMRHPAANAVVVDDSGRLAAEEVKVIVRDGRLVRIGKQLPPAECFGEAIGLNKIGAAAASSLVPIYEDLEARGERSHFFEAGFDRLAAEGGDSRHAFGLVATAGRPWMEIDTLEDYENARRRIAPHLRD
jgi:choline kinase